MASPTTRNGKTAAGESGESGEARTSASPAAQGWRRYIPQIRLEAPRWAAPLLRPHWPGVAVLFNRDGFTLVRLDLNKGGTPLTHALIEGLPQDSLVPSLTEANIKSPAEVAARLEKALGGLPDRAKLSGISVVLPDACARVILLTLTDIPHSPRQATQMIRWHIRKRVPFELDKARLAVQRFPLPDGSERVVVALALDRVLAQYEQLMQSLGLQPGLLDLSTFNLANLCAADTRQGDSCVLNVADDELTVLVVRDGTPLFYRSKPLIHDSRRDPEKSRKELQRELATTATYYNERLRGESGGLQRVLLRQPEGSGDFDRMAADALGAAPVRVDLARVAMELAGGQVTGRDAERAAPAVGAVVGR